MAAILVEGKASTIQHRILSMHGAGVGLVRTCLWKRSGRFRQVFGEEMFIFGRTSRYNCADLCFLD
jgi:hypothetical protein